MRSANTDSNKDDFFESLQSWEGTVSFIGKETFSARLTDLTASFPTPDEEVELKVSDIHSDDLSLLEEGAGFYWTLGYRTRDGIRRKESVIRFKRLPSWSEQELTTAKAVSKEIAEVFSPTISD